MTIDIIISLLIAVFFIIGLVQGFVVSLLIFAAWIVGILSAWLLSETFASMLSANIKNLAPLLAMCFGGILAFLIPFLLVRIAAFIANSFIRKHAPLSATNRILGGVFGTLKGVTIAGIILTFVHLLPAQGVFRQTVEKSVAYSIYQSLPFAKVWDEFKTETEELKMEI